MPTLTYSNTLTQGTTANATDVQGNFDDVKTLLNTTKLDADNLQTSIITNALVSSSAAIAVSKLATTTPGYVLLGTTTTGVPTYTAISGDITVTGAGVTAIGNNKITNAMLGDGVVDTAELAAGAVETAKIEDLNVTTGKLAADAVTGAKLADDAVDSEHITDGAIDTAHIADAQVTAAKMDFGGSGSGVWWREVGRAAGSGASSIAITGMTSYKFLKIIIYINPTAGYQPALRLNADSGNNYGNRREDNNATIANTDNTDLVTLDGNTTALKRYTVIDLYSVSSVNKMGHYHTVSGTTGANAPEGSQGFFRWNNTADNITGVSVVRNSGTGNLNSDSEIIVLGHG